MFIHFFFLQMQQDLVWKYVCVCMYVHMDKYNYAPVFKYLINSTFFSYALNEGNLWQSKSQLQSLTILNLSNNINECYFFLLFLSNFRHPFSWPPCFNMCPSPPASPPTICPHVILPPENSCPVSFFSQSDFLFCEAFYSFPFLWRIHAFYSTHIFLIA